MVCEIGAAQETGTLIIAKNLLEANLGAPATIRRRLERLVKLGIVTKTKGKVMHVRPCFTCPRMQLKPMQNLRNS